MGVLNEKRCKIMRIYEGGLFSNNLNLSENNYISKG